MRGRWFGASAAATALAIVFAASGGRPRLPALGPLVTAIEGPPTFSDLVRGRIELTPAIGPPTSEDGQLRIVVFLELPARGELHVAMRDGATALEAPTGTLATRVEALAADDNRAAWRVLDVRETHFDEARRERFRLLRPRRGGGLTGLAWPRSEVGQRQANEAIARLFEADVFDGPIDPHVRGTAAARLVRMNDCASCHMAWRAEDRRPGALVQRGTDGQGLYSLLAVFSDTGPFETYRSRNASAESRFVHVRCAGEDVARNTQTCADGERPSGWLDVRTALDAGDAHANRVCASRRSLADRMDKTARLTFAELLAECRISAVR